MDIREINGKKVEIKEHECPKFKSKLENAKENIDLAICGLEYDSMPDLNKEILDELKDISRRLEELKKTNPLVPFNI